MTKRAGRSSDVGRGTHARGSGHLVAVRSYVDRWILAGAVLATLVGTAGWPFFMLWTIPAAPVLGWVAGSQHDGSAETAGRTALVSIAVGVAGVVVPIGLLGVLWSVSLLHSGDFHPMILLFVFVWVITFLIAVAVGAPLAWYFARAAADD